MIAGARFCDAVVGRPIETAHRQVAVWCRRDGVPSRNFERRATKILGYFPAQKSDRRLAASGRSMPT
jgi:hypothetical protein